MNKIQKTFKRINDYLKKEEGSITAYPQGIIIATIAVIAFVLFSIFINK